MATQSYKTKNGLTRYRVVVRDSRGRKFPSKSFAKQADAKKYERELILRRDRGAVSSTIALRNMLVDQYWVLWRRKCRRCSEGWAKSQDQMYRDYVHPILGKRKLSDLKPVDIGDVMASMRKIGRGDQMCRHVYNLLNQIFSDINDYFKIPVENPCSKKDRPIVGDVAERTVLTPEQGFKLLDVSKGEYIGPAIWISVLAGPRPGEVQALRWENVCFDMNMIKIKEGYRRKESKIAAPKNKRRDRVKPLIKPLGEYLYPLSKDRSPSDFVIPGILGDMLTYNTFHRHTQVACQLAGVPVVTPHELRHSCTEIWMRAGAIEEDIIRLLSHSGSGSVRRYIHPTNGRLDRIGENIKPSLHIVNE